MSSWTSEFYDAGGVKLHYVRTGGSKPPLVLLHGLTASGACWTPLARALEDRFDVIMPDARGHGRSDAPLHGYRYDDLASDVTALLRSLDLQRPIVMGHSLGGLTAAVVAAKRDASTGAVVLVDPTFISEQRQREVRDSNVGDAHRRMLALSEAEIAADLRARHPHRSAEIVALLAQARLQTRLAAFDVLTPPNPEYAALIRKIAVPALLVISGRGVVSRDTASELRAAQPLLRIAEIENAGHGIPYDRPDQLVEAIRSFCNESISNATGLHVPAFVTSEEQAVMPTARSRSARMANRSPGLDGGG